MLDSCNTPPSTRERLISTAAELLLRQSFGAVSVDDICKAADIKKGTFYHYFPSKVDLVLAAYDYKWDCMRKHMDPCFDRKIAPHDRLRNFAQGVYDFHNEMYKREGKIYGCCFASAGHEMGTQDERIRVKTKQIFDLHVSYFRGVVEDLPSYAGASPEKIESIACEMHSYVLGIFYQAKVNNDPEVIRRDLYAGLMRFTGSDAPPRTREAELA